MSMQKSTKSSTMRSMSILNPPGGSGMAENSISQYSLSSPIWKRGEHVWIRGV